MEPVEITLKLPPEFAQDAQDFGLLDADAILQVLRAELDERIMKFVDSEIKIYREEQRTKDEDA